MSRLVSWSSSRDLIFLPIMSWYLLDIVPSFSFDTHLFTEFIFSLVLQRILKLQITIWWSEARRPLENFWHVDDWFPFAVYHVEVNFVSIPPIRRLPLSILDLFCLKLCLLVSSFLPCKSLRAFLLYCSFRHIQNVQWHSSMCSSLSPLLRLGHLVLLQSVGLACRLQFVEVDHKIHRPFPPCLPYLVHKPEWLLRLPPVFGIWLWWV